MSQPPEQPGREPVSGTPGWVKVFGVIAVILAVLFISMLLLGGEHGPGRHLPSQHPASLALLVEHASGAL